MFDNHGNRVVPFGRGREAEGFRATGEVRAYWEALRDGRAAPCRSEVDPRGIERVLEHAFILERIAPQVARFRLAGMHLNDFLGMEVRGMPFCALFTAAARAEVGMILDSVFSGPRTAELAISGESGIGRPALEGRIVLLPLRSDLGDISRALGCLVAEGAIGRTPRRFDLCGSLTRPIEATAPGCSRPATVRPASPVPPRGCAEPAAPFAGAAARPAGTRPHLRLVTGGD